ncbi:MAG: carbohydrate kinase family protein [Flammeovirgaceae bacterium]
MKKITIIGGASIDSIIYLEDFPQPEPQTIHQCEFKETIGSTGSGKALNLCRLNFDVRLHAVIGNDLYGRWIKDFLTHPNLSFEYDYNAFGTERHTNLMTKDGKRISIFTNNIDDEPQINYEKFGPWIAESDVVIVNLSNYSRNTLAICKELGKKVWVDLHDYDGINTFHQDYINYADYVFLSSDNLPNYKAWMQKWINEEKEWVVCTHGAAGATALDGAGKWYEQPALTHYELIDSNGAGDAFSAGFIYAFMQEKGMADCLKYATIAGALCIHSPEVFGTALSPATLEKTFTENYGT